MKVMNIIVLSAMFWEALVGCSSTTNILENYPIVYYDYLVREKVLDNSEYVWDGRYSYHLTQPLPDDFWYLKALSGNDKMWIYPDIDHIHRDKARLLYNWPYRTSYCLFNHRDKKANRNIESKKTSEY